MIRRLLILAGSFAAIFVLFLVVKLLAPQIGKTGKPIPKRDRPAKVAASRSRPSESGSEARGGEVLNVVTRDDAGRLESVYWAHRWNKLDDGSYELILPCMEMRQANGQRAYIHADRGVVLAEEVAGGVSIRRGRLIGNVKIYLDRIKIGERPGFADMKEADEPAAVYAQLDERAADMIRIFAEDLTFTNDPAEIHTDGRVLIFSAEADIVGDGLTIRWHEEPRELNWLRIERGRQIAVYNVPEQANLLVMPGSDEVETPAESVTGEQPEKVELTETELDESDDAAAEDAPETADAEEVDAESAAEEADAVAETPSEPPSEDSAEIGPAIEPEGDAPPVAKNIYTAVFHDQVNVDSGDRFLRNAETLTLQFEWGQEAQGRLRQRLEGTSGVPAPEEPAAEAAEEPTDADEAAAAEATGPTDEEATEPADEEAAGDEAPGSSSTPVTITWRGPLVIQPIDYTPTPVNNRYVITAAGKNVQLGDARAEVTCQTLTFRHPERTGTLTGAEGQPTRLLLAGDQEAVCREIHFDVPAGKILLMGPGYITQGGAKQAGAEPDSSVEPFSQLGDAGSITWQDRMEANFGEVEVKEPDGTTETRQFIKDAIFYGDVVLSQGPSEEPAESAAAGAPAGNYVRCDVLRVWMTRDPTGKIVPEVAVAQGNVSGRQEGSDIQAGQATVFFDSIEELNTEGLPELRLRPSMVMAEQNVRLTDERDGQRIEATADRVESDLLERMAVLYGDETEAMILRGENLLAGNKIHLDQDRQMSVVDGKGRMRFMVSSDMDGNKLDEPRPVDITWDEGMEYHGKSSAATFLGNVELVSDMESMTCQRMRVLFEKDAADDDEPPTPAEVKESRRRSTGLDLERYSRRRLAMILAYGDVALRSREEDAQQRLQRRMQLSGQQLMYDVTMQELTMPEPGSLLVEDYRSPADAAEAAADGESNQVRSPSQSAFKWTRLMHLQQRERRVELEGKVQMVHRSGNEIIRMEGLKTPEWGELSKGRRTLLHCRQMEARFGEPAPREEEPDDKPTGKYDVGPRLGPLEIFAANGNVNLVDGLAGGDMQVLGERLRYDRRKNEAIVWGFVPGQPVTDAQLVYEEKASGRSQSFSNPKMIFELDGTNVKKAILEDDVYGTGVR